MIIIYNKDKQKVQDLVDKIQKLSGFNRKKKNQARKKLEHQALKYQNKHWKK